MKVLINDKIVDREEASIDIEDRGYQFGDGVYEVVRLYNGQFFTFDEHIDRLYASAAKIDLVIPYPKDILKNLLKQLASENNIHTGNVYLQVTRGIQIPRNHVIPDDLPLEGVLTATAREVPRNEALFVTGGKAITDEDVRWLRCDIKSISLLGNIMSKNKAHREGALEAILHRGDTITECSASNVFIIKDGVLWTHSADNLILNGITRQVIIKAAGKGGIPVREANFTVSDLLAADEVFISSTTLEVTPITTVDDTVIGTGLRGPVTQKVHELFEAEIVAECGELLPV
ncbi:D-amino acid aminotransferase [Listeria floridensis FSL S10-1187]|uniref:D-alanine aminotransferase n=1 Tax=Listeria floridensis FSL S10-1187 TaxID=1265817 RepID=A0ABN0RGD5_9LIST|nr:D-amino-acid transaminase [Listeria floridensis]EUJ32855.1 D-amino acid aminotransferase [Listeria floridensis FSL S10-1187]